ncbi:hypothetical protein [Ralstonia sp. GP101]|uniref:hypothetical protein n=1 Tax=Ralstonia sp. GP101 TaxID=3035146 RepID=UPI003892C0E7
MTNEHRSDYPNRGWNRIPECYRAIDTWPSADESLLKGQKNRSRYRRLCTGIQLYLERRPLADVQAATGLSKRRFLAIVERCLQGCPRRTHLGAARVRGRGAGQHATAMQGAHRARQ